MMVDIWSSVLTDLFCCSDAIVNQVLDELGLQMNEKLSNLPQAAGGLSTGAKQQPVATAVGDADADLQARLDNLRRE